MRADVKERIAMIERGEVPKGYKKDNNYVIPMNWAYMNLEKIVTSSDYGTSESTNDVDGIPVLRMGNLADGKIYTKDLVYLNLTEEEIERYRLNKGDILFNRTNSYDLVGKVALFALDGDYTFASYLVRLVINKNIADPAYVNFFMNLESSQRKIRDFATKGVQQVNVNPTVLKKYFMILVPSIQEQEQIKSIIQHWDRAIELKEKLLEQKKLQKRGLMERLLTGKARLPGFSGEWRKIKLRDVVERVTRRNDVGNTDVLTISAQRGLVSQMDYFNRSVASETLDNYFLLKKGEFAYNKSYSNGYPMGAIKRLNGYSEGVVTTLYICFKLRDDTTNSDFFEQYFEAGLLNKALMKITQEGARAHGLLNIAVSDFFEISICIPPKFEQEAIAAILVCSDLAIQKLEQEIAQLKAQKKGLMQLLLTGKVRVPC